MFYKSFFVKLKIIAPVLAIFFLSAGCIHINLFEKQVAIPSQGWKYDFKPNYSFEIRDTATRYYIYIVIRHKDLYQFNNIWLRVGSAAPGKQMEFHNVNVTLAGTDSWDGTGMDDIYEVRKMISPGAVSFRSSGTYSFSIAQIMRENPLRYILDVGIRLEKAE